MVDIIKNLWNEFKTRNGKRKIAVIGLLAVTGLVLIPDWAGPIVAGAIAASVIILGYQHIKRTNK